MNSLYIFKFCFSMYFNSSWTEMSFIDMITNSLLEIWNLVWTKRQTGQATTKNSPFTLLYMGTTNVHIFPFSSARVSSEILSKASLFLMNSRSIYYGQRSAWRLVESSGAPWLLFLFWLLFAFWLVGYSSLQWCICYTACHWLCFVFSYKRSFFFSWKTRCSSSTWPKVSVFSDLLIPKLSNEF